MDIGIRWDNGPVISAEDIKRLLGQSRLKQLVVGKDSCPVVVMICDGKQVAYFEKKVIAEDGSMSDPLWLTYRLEMYFQKTFGFRPERVIRTNTGIITWKEYWDEVGRRLEAMPKPRGWEI